MPKGWVRLAATTAVAVTHTREERRNKPVYNGLPYIPIPKSEATKNSIPEVSICIPLPDTKLMYAHDPKHDVSEPI